MGDILSYPELNDCTFNLFDIDGERLDTSELVDHFGTAAHVRAFTDRREALQDADYVICIQVGGYKSSTVIDFGIPKKYGLRQTIGDPLCIGGIFRSLRTIPVLINLVRDMEDICPDALLMNYVNPMAMNMWAIAEASDIRAVGLCHSVQGTAELLAQDIEVPIHDINYVAAGINRCAFYLNFERDGEELYPKLNQVIAEDRARLWNSARYEMLKRTGYFVTESSEHFAEYGPWLIKRDRPDLIEQFHIPLDEYITRCERQIAECGDMRNRFEGNEPMEHIRTHEYASQIVVGIESNIPTTVYGNVPNKGLISNLPHDCCVEVPCLVDRNGRQPVRIGELPVHLAAMMQTNINVQRLTVEAALTGKREHIYHAARIDPHAAAELDLDQIWNLVDDLVEAHGDYCRRIRRDAKTRATGCHPGLRPSGRRLPAPRTLHGIVP